MEKDAIIVEFFGLPGSGKTTLVKELKSFLESDGYNVGLWHDITHAFKKASLKEKIESIDLFNMLRCIYLSSKVKKIVLRRWYVYWFMIKIGILYHFAKKEHMFDVVLIDHGYLQNAISMVNGEKILDKPAFLPCLVTTINKGVLPDLFVYCDIAVAESKRRIRLRDRKEGRLDAIDDDIALMTELENEKCNFEAVETAVKSQVQRVPMISSDMTLKFDNAALEDILKHISRK